MRTIATDVARSVVCASVCVSVSVLGTWVSPAQMAKLIKMPFRGLTHVGPGNRVLDGGPDLTREGALLKGNMCRPYC